jgi:HSP20 family protein
MPTFKWSPSLERNLPQYFEGIRRVLDESLRSSDKEFSAAGWFPPVDIYESDDRIVLTAEVPGLHRTDIEVEIAENVLTLSGEKRLVRDVEEGNYYRLERSYGSFHRSFVLPKSVDQERVTAVYKDGVLEVSLPKVDRYQGSMVKVKID